MQLIPQVLPWDRWSPADTPDGEVASAAVLLRLPLRASFGLAPRASIEVEFPLEAQWVRAPTGEDGSRFVPGDLTVGVQLWPVLPRGSGVVRAGAFLGASLPTGASGGDLLAYEQGGVSLRTGSGTVDPVLGGDVLVFTPTVAFVSSWARARLPLYANGEGYRRGISLSEGVELGLREPRGRLVVQVGVEGFHAASDEVSSEGDGAGGIATAAGVPTALPMHAAGEVHDGRRHEVAFTAAVSLLPSRTWALAARVRAPFLRFAGEPQVMSPVDVSLSVSAVLGPPSRRGGTGEGHGHPGEAVPPPEPAPPQ